MRDTDSIHATETRATATTLTATDFATFLEADPGKRATKRYHGPALKPDSYDAGKFFEPSEAFVNSLRDLCRVLEMALGVPEVMLIRGRLKPGLSGAKRVRKTYHPDAENPSPAFERAEHRWVMADVDDKCAAPFDPADPRGSVERWRAGLPAGLRDAAMIWLFSASSHLSPTLRGHAFFWSGAPLDDVRLRSWAKAHGFDPMLYNPVQPHYVAAPLFPDGVADPLGEHRKPLWFNGGDAVIDLSKYEPAKVYRDGKAYDVPEDRVATDDNLKRLAKAVTHAWERDGRQKWWLPFLGWMLHAGYGRGDLVVLLAQLFEVRGDNENGTIAGMPYRADPSRVKGPGQAVREALGADFDAVDAIIEEHKLRGLNEVRFGEAGKERSAPANGEGEPGAERQSATEDYSVSQSITSLASYGDVYQRGQVLSMITRSPKRDKSGLVRPTGAPTINAVNPVRLEEMLDALRLPAKHGRFILARKQWADIQPLEGLVRHPVLRPDGSVLTESGYDAATCTYADINVQVTVGETLADAQAALALLHELVCDFPFASDADRATWVCGVLTPLARPAMGNNPAPLFLNEANARGAGKGNLCDLVGIICVGGELTRRVAPKTQEEWQKTIFAVALGGEEIVLIDNITDMLRSDALDAIMTAKEYGGRVLGGSVERTVPMRTTWFATANNPRLSTDLVRRSLRCHLESQTERPELRTDFKHSDLLGHALAERAQYLSAALTILRAYAVAGRPKVDGRKLGSYESWCRAVRDAVIWAGGADPTTTQDEMRENSDVERDGLLALLTSWEAALGDKGVTARELIDLATYKLKSNAENEPEARELRDKINRLEGAIEAKYQAAQQADAGPGGLKAARAAVAADEAELLQARASLEPKLELSRAKATALSDALEGLMHTGSKLTAHALGNRLRQLKGNIADGMSLLESKDTHTKVTRYRLERKPK